MATKPLFVGRRDELRQFAELLHNPAGQAVVVVGHTGMGKTLLVNRMASAAGAHPELQCASVRYDATESDSPSVLMALMIDNAFDAASVEAGSVDLTDQRSRQWAALIKLLPKGRELVELVRSLRRDAKRHTREQFIERLALISKRMPEAARAIFIVDPEKRMQPGSQDDWRLVVRNLPEKIKLVFAQRPDDVLVNSTEFMALQNVVRIPHGVLDVLDDQAIDDLLTARRPDLPVSGRELRDAIGRFQGHAYAIVAALDLLATGQAIVDLPPDPTPQRIAETQWRQVRDRPNGNKAVALFEAYAVLDVAVPDELVEAVSELDSATRKALLGNAYVATLLRDEPTGRRIYHALLADCVRNQLSDSEKKDYHRRAAAAYRTRLTTDTNPHAQAAQRLPEHVLAADGPEAFVSCVADECFSPLWTLGLLDTANDLVQHAQQYTSKGSVERAQLLLGLGIVYADRGDYDHAEVAYRECLEIYEGLGLLKDVALVYNNIGVLHRARVVHGCGGDLNRAEEMFRKSLAICEKQKEGRLEDIARLCRNLGEVYRLRGNFDEAEAMHRKSLEIGEVLGSSSELADTYGYLGVVYMERGDLDQAEVMHRKSLEVNEKLGRQLGIAGDYYDLGIVCWKCGDAIAARNYWHQARDLFAMCGMKRELDAAEKRLAESGEAE